MPALFCGSFPPIFGSPSQADFFRYLVLYLEGGVYADVDVMLNANLDDFVAPDLAFFAPIDAVGNFADEPFCLWNGLLGAAPAHPALARVIEWMLDLVARRGDLYDMERAVCRRAGPGRPVESWKVRAEPGLLLGGPCALGLALNAALGNAPLARFRPGLLWRRGYNGRGISGVDEEAIGNVLLLMVSVRLIARRLFLEVGSAVFGEFHC